jgi:hypothetical protein
MGNIQHKSLSKGRWQKKSFLEQMANIGSEIYRAINWKEKNNKEYSEKAFVRSLELFDMSKSSKLTHTQLKELLRAREIWVDFFKYENIFNSTGEGINNYFKYLTISSRN